MKFPHLFEFMDQPWLPDGLAATLREILSCGNAAPFRQYYAWVAERVAEIAREKGCSQIVELGAGTAPITRELVKKPSLDRVTFIVCDARPDRATYEVLQRQFAGRIAPRFEPVDFSVPQRWPEGTLLVLSGTFHHIPAEERVRVLKALSDSADAVLIAEPLRKTLPSMGFVFLSVIPALLLPLWYFVRPGKARRFFWCWLLPIAPIIFWWDGLVSCIRMWTEPEWRQHLIGVVPDKRELSLVHSFFSQMVGW